MHNLFLGLIKEHFEILGIRDPEDGIAFRIDIPFSVHDSLNNPQIKSMERIVRLLQCPLNKKLTSDTFEFEIHLKKLQNCHAAALEKFSQAFDITTSLSNQASTNKKRYKKIDLARCNFDLGKLLFLSQFFSLHSLNNLLL